MLFGIGIFLLGSVLCGLAWNMIVLIVFRAVQGIGAGAIQPTAMTIVGDLYSVAERARVQGYLSSVWAIAAVLGPTFGGSFSQYLSWRWIFFLNIPVAGLATWMLLARFRERDLVRARHRIDALGATLLTGGCTLLILGLLEGGVAWAWDSPASLAIFGLGAAMLAAFIPVEMRAPEPVLPLWVFRRAIFIGANLGSLAIGWVMIGYTSFIPDYAQGALGATAVVSGFVLAALSIGWPLASTFVGKIYLRIGFRATALLGGLTGLGGALLCLRLGVGTSLWYIAAATFVVGVGLGLMSAPALVAVQSAVDWDRRGVATGAIMFSRSIGSAVGAATLGAIANTATAHRLAHPPAALAGQLPPSADATRVLLGAHVDAGSPVVRFLRQALADATHNVMLCLVVVALAGAAAVLLLPARPSAEPEDPRTHHPSEGTDT
jgi:MFS family permease